MTLKFIVCLGAFVEDLVAFKFCRDNYMLLTCDSSYILYSCIIFFSTKKKKLLIYIYIFLESFNRRPLLMMLFIIIPKHVKLTETHVTYMYFITCDLEKKKKKSTQN